MLTVLSQKFPVTPDEYYLPHEIKQSSNIKQIIENPTLVQPPHQKCGLFPKTIATRFPSDPVPLPYSSLFIIRSTSQIVVYLFTLLYSFLQPVIQIVGLWRQAKYGKKTSQHVLKDQFCLNILSLLNSMQATSSTQLTLCYFLVKLFLFLM